MVSPSDETQIALIGKDISYIRDEISNIKNQFAQNYMPIKDGELLKSRVTQLERVLYGFVALILLGVGGAMVSGVLK